MNSPGTDKPQLSIFVLGPLETNCYLFYGNVSLKGVLIDPGEGDEDVRKAIQEKGVDVQYVVNTHGHADHIKGDAYFGAPVAIHQLDENCLSNPLRNLSFHAGWCFKPVKAQRLLSDGDIIKIGGLELEVIHTPGHTPGGICLKCGDILFSGDTLFFEGIGRTDLPGGDQRAIIKSIREKLLTLPDNVRVFPGHGGQTTIGHEKKFNPLFAGTQEDRI
jgi:hydroxyacylglutathione hydrolase